MSLLPGNAQTPGVPFTGTSTVNMPGVIDGAQSSGYFLQSGGDLTLQNVTLRNFSTTGGEGSGGGGGFGGAIFINDSGTVVLENVNLENNTAIGGRGGVGTLGGVLNNMGVLSGGQADDGADGPPTTSVGLKLPSGNGVAGRAGQHGENGVGQFGGNGGDGSFGESGNVAYLGVLNVRATETTRLTTVATAASTALASANTRLADATAGLATANARLATAQANLTAASLPGPPAGVPPTPLPPDPRIIANATQQVALATADVDLAQNDLTFAQADVQAKTTALNSANGALARYQNDTNIFVARLAAGQAGNGGNGANGGRGGNGGFGLGGGTGGDGGFGGEVMTGGGGSGGNGGSGGRGGNGGFGGGGGRGGQGGAGGTNLLGLPLISRPGLDGGAGAGGSGGFGGGNGSTGTSTSANGSGGGGGSGFGGGIFVNAGGSLTVKGNSTFIGNNVEGGSSNNGGSAGQAIGSDLFIMKGSDVTLEAGAGNTINFYGTIADDSFASIGEAANHQTGQGADITIGEGRVVYHSLNTYTGVTTLKEGAVLEVNKFDFSDAEKFALNKNSNLKFEGGVFQSKGHFQRFLGTGSDDVQFAGSGGFAAAGGELEVTLNNNGPLTWGVNHFVPDGSNLLFGSDTATHDVTFNNDIDLNGGARTILVNSQNAILTGVLSNGSLVVGDANNRGTLILEEDNSFAGGTTVNGGTLKLMESAGLNDNGTVTVNTSALLDLSEAGDQAIGDLSGGGEVNLGDNTLTVNQAGNTEFSGALSDHGTLGPDGSKFIKQGNGILTVSGTNTAVGGFEIRSGQVNLTGSLENRMVQIDAGATLENQNGGLSEFAEVTNDGVLDINATNDTITTLNNTGTVEGTATLTATTYNLNEGSTINANLGTGTINANGTVQINGTSMAENVNVQTGTTTLGSAERLNDAASVNVSGPAKLLLGGDERIGELLGSGEVALDQGTLTVNRGDFSGTLSQMAPGNDNEGLTKIDANGTLKLTGTSTYTGDTNVQEGTLTLDGAGNLATKVVNITNGATMNNNTGGLIDAVIVNTDGTFRLGANEKIAELNGAASGVVDLADGDLEVSTGNFAGNVKGGNDRILKKVDAGDLTLSGQNELTGQTDIQAGTVKLTGSLASLQVDVATGAKLDSSNGGLANGATLNNNGTTDIGSVNDTITTLNNTGTVDGTATLTATTYNLNEGSTINANLGTGTINANGTVQINGTSMAENVNVQTGTTTLGSAERLNNAAVLDVDGKLVLGGNETIATLNGANTGEVDITNGDFTLNDGNFAGAITSTNNSRVVNKNTAGELTLSGNNTYLGETNINAGKVNLTGSLASLQIDVAMGATLDSTNGGLASGATLNNDGTTDIKGTNDTITTLNNTGTLNGSATLTATTYNLNDGSEVNANLGEGVLNSNGNVTLNGTASAKTVNIQTGSTTLGSAERLDDTAVVTVSNPARLLLGGNEKIGDLQGAGEVTLDKGSLTVSRGNFSGMLTQQASGNDSFGLTKVDAGTLTLTGASNFTGPTNVEAGALTLSGTGSLATKVVNIQNGAAMNNNNGGLMDEVIVNLDGTLNNAAIEKIAQLNGDNTGLLNLTTGDLEVSKGNYAGNILGGAARTLTKVGNEALTLSGGIGFGGSTVVQAGTLNLTGTLASQQVDVAVGAMLNSPNGGLAANATLNNNGTTNIGSRNDTIATLNNSGTLNGSATLTATTYNLNDGSIVNVNLGEGVVNSNGMTTLNGTSGADIVNVLSGGLTLGRAELLDDVSAVNLIGGDLTLGGRETIGSLTGSGMVNARGFELIVGTLTGFTGTLNAQTPPGAEPSPITITGNTTLTATINSPSGLIIIDSDNFTLGPNSNFNGETIQVTSMSQVNVNGGVFNAGVLELAAGSVLNLVDPSNFTYDELNGGLQVDANGNLITAFIETNGETFVNPEGSTVSGFITFSDAFRNEGVLALGASPGLTFINTDYTETGTLEIEIENSTPITGHDQVQVGGTVTAAPGSTLVVQTFNGAMPTRGQIYQIISDNAGNSIQILGNFDRVLYDPDGTAGPLAAQMNAAAVLDMATGQLITTGLNQPGSTFSDLGSTENQQLVAAALFASAEQESGGSNQINTTQEFGQAASATLLGTTSEALNKLSPEFFGSMRTYSTSDDEARFQRIFDRIEARRLGPGGDTIVMTDAPQGSGWGESTVQIYAGGAGTFGDFDDSENQGNYNFVSGTGFVGADFAVTQNIYLGVVASGNGGHIDATFGNVDVVGWNATAYLIVNPIDNLNVILAGGGGTYSYETSRTTVLGNADGSTDATTYGGFAGVQYAIPLSGGVELVPFINGVFTNYNRDGFTESGPADALQVGSMDQAYVASNVGARVQWQTVMGNVLPFRIAASAAWNHQYTDNQGSFQNTFIGSGVGFTTNTPGTGKDGVDVGIGLQMGVLENTDLFLNYDGQFQTDGYLRNSVNAGVTIKL